jgi:TPR repeat protein
MNTKTTLLLPIFALVAVVTALPNGIRDHQPSQIGDSPAEDYFIPYAAYQRLVQAADAGHCEATYRLGRHHAFYSLNADAAVRWYRLAARCPHAIAKRALIGLLTHRESPDAEVDRLLLEIERLDPSAAANDRAAVTAVRTSREPR